MASEQPRSPALPAGADDFKLIHGIGPGIANRLYAAGICRFEQLAARTPDEVALVVADIAGMSAERIVKQDWIGQAQEFSNQPAADQPAAEPGSSVRQHYATFTIELLLDEHNDVRRTRAVHVQSGVKTTWAGWDQERVSAFLIEQSGLAGEPSTEEHQPRAELVLTGAAAAQRFVECGEPFDVRLALDLANIAQLRGVPVGYTATIFAKQLGGQRNLIGEERGSLLFDQHASVTVQGNLAQSGVYRIEALFTITDPAVGAFFQKPPTAQLEGSLVSAW